MWFTETPWPPIIIVAVFAALLVGLWYPNRRGWPLIGVGVCVIACFAIYYVEKAIVTDRERVEGSVIEMVAACKRNDVDGTIAFLSPQAQLLRTEIALAMALADVEDDVHVTDLNVRMVANQTQAISHFRANGTVNIPSLGHHGAHPSRWEFTWQKTGEDWKVIEIRRLSVIEGREMKLLERTE